MDEEASEEMEAPLMGSIKNLIECAVDYRYMYCRYGEVWLCIYRVNEN